MAEQLHGQGQRHSQGAQARVAEGKSEGHSCRNSSKNTPPLGRLLPRYDPGREIPRGLCIRPLVPMVAPAPRCPLPACRDSPCFSTLVPRHHMQKATGSAFFRYGRDTTAQAGDFPRQLGLNFKPLVLSLSRAVLGSWEKEQSPGVSPPHSQPQPAQESPSPSATTHSTPRHHMGTSGAVTQGTWKSQAALPGLGDFAARKAADTQG